MNTENINQDQMNLMAHDGVSLLLRRTLRQLVAATRAKVEELDAAATKDYGAITSTAEIAPATTEVMTQIAEILGAAADDILALQTYWESLPWSSEIHHDDPRRQASDDPRRQASDDAAEVLLRASDDAAEALLRAVVAQMATMQGRDKQEATTEGKGTPSAADKIASAPEVKGAARTGVLGAGVGGYPVESTSPPGPDFEPALLSAKRVVVADLKNDVRERRTLGNPKVDFVIGGEPVLWLVAADATRVAITRDHSRNVLEILTKFANGA